MNTMAEYTGRPEDIGDILIKVHEDLRHLKSQLLTQKSSDGQSVDISSLEAAIDRTEDGLRMKTEQVMNHINNKVLTLPSLETSLSQQPGDYNAMETMWDLGNSRGDMGTRKIQPQKMDMVKSREISRRPLPPVTKNVKKTGQAQVLGPSPGEKTQQMYTMKLVSNPENTQNRQVLHENYGIQLPLLVENKPQKALSAKVLKGSTVDALTVLPKANRVDPQLNPPPISEGDAKKGILSLIERGLIPPAAELTLDPSPVRNKMAPLHNPDSKDRIKVPTAVNNDGVFNAAGVKLDNRVRGATEGSSPSHSPTLQNNSTSSTKSARAVRKTSAARTVASMKVFEMPLQPMPPPTTPASGEVKASGHRFAIQHGRTRDMAHDFLGFKQHYCLSWGSIVTMIKHLEKVLRNYAIPIAFINGDKLAELSLEFELEKPPGVEDLMGVIMNREDVESMLLKPGRRFVGPNGEHVAATKIQAGFRMYRDRIQYLEYRRRKWAAGVIIISWIMHVKLSKIRRQLIQTRMDQLENFKTRAKKFSTSWDRIKNSRRVIIHIPSLGFTQGIRDTLRNFPIRQNTQMARLCDIRDPNVDVIYISPVPINEEQQQYYSKLLGLKTAIDSGNVEDQGSLQDRYKIIVPESINSFPSHHMALSTLLKYSHKALQRIRNLIRGREAYIVPGIPSKDDLDLADYLGVPMLSSEPEIAHLYTTKSGSKRIFVSSGVAMPPGEFDIYSIQQLHECLAQLVTENLEVRRWLFKLDDEFNGRGIAYCDIADYMDCYAWACKEAARYGEKWSKKWAQEAAFLKIHAEIPEVLTRYGQPANTEVYPTWESFLEAFLSLGGVIEAHPPSDSVTALSVDMLIEPNGQVQIVSLGDQIHAENQLQCWGMSVPQSSVEPDVLNEACRRVAEGCKTRGVVGYFTIDFVTFIHPKSMDQLLWAVDLNLSYSDSVAMAQLMYYTTNGVLDPKTHVFNVPPPKAEKRRRRKWEPESPPPSTSRYAVMSTQLLHTNLAVVHYSVFFQMCRAHGIGYDVKEKQGTVFTLIDSFKRENLGMISIGDNLQGALATFARNLSVIHQEISAPNMQGETNFKAVIEDIEGILGTTIQNAEETSNDQDGKKSPSSPSPNGEKGAS